MLRSCVCLAILSNVFMTFLKSFRSFLPQSNAQMNRLARSMSKMVHPRVTQWPPDHGVFPRALPQPLWDLEAVVSKVLHHGEGRLRGRKHRKDLAHRMLHFLIRVEHDLAGRI